MATVLAEAGRLAGALAVLSGIGFGPAVWLAAGRHTRRDGFLLAPVLGLALLGFVLHPLVMSGLPVARTWVAVTAALLLASALLARPGLRRAPAAPAAELREPLLAAGATAALLVVLCAPFAPRDLDHRLWQGNGFDAANYMLLASYVEELPVEWARDAAGQQRVVDRDPAASTVIPLVPSMRLATSVVLAWMASVQGRAVYECYTPFKLLNLAIALPVTLAAGRRLGLGPLRRSGLAAVVSAGFWSFHVVDIDAASQANALPLSVLALAGWLQAEQEAPGRIFGRERLLFAVALGAMLCYYGELLPLLLAALVCERLLALRAARGPGLVLAQPAASAALGAALLAPTLGSHLDYLHRVADTAFARPRPGWGGAFYPFLFDNGFSLAGLWGLHFWRVAAGASLPLRAAVMALALAFTACVVAALVRGLRNPALPAGRILAATVLGFWGGAFVLWRVADPWLAGKGFAYGAPFAAAAVFAVPGRERLRPLAAAVAAAFALTQVATAAWRLPATRPGGGALPGYVRLRTEGIEEVRQAGALGTADMAVDFTGEPEPLRRAWMILLSRQPGLLPLPGLPRYHAGPARWWKESETLPARVLLPRAGDYLGPLGLRPEGSSAHLVLYRVTPADLDRALTAAGSPRWGMPGSVVPQGITCEAAAGEGPPPGCWLEPEGAGLRFLASGAEPFRLRLSIVPSYGGPWRVDVNGVSAVDVPVQAGAMREFTLAVLPRHGTNWIRFHQPARVRLRSLEVAG